MAKRKPGSKPKTKKSQVSKKSESTPESDVVEKQSEQDTHVEGALAASEAAGIVDALEKNRLYLIGISVALFAVICFFLIFKQLGRDRGSKAAQAYTSAAIAEDIPALDQVVTNFGNSTAAGNALLTKADLQIKEGADEAAEATLNKMASEYSSHPRHVQAYYMLANLFFKNKKYDEAIANYEKVQSVGPNSELAPLSALRIGDVKLAQGDADAAKQQYDDALSKYGEGNYEFAVAQLVESRKMQLGVAMPREVPNPDADAGEATTEEPPATTGQNTTEPEVEEPATDTATEPTPDAATPDESGFIPLTEKVKLFADKLTSIEVADENALDQIYTDFSADGSSKFLYRIQFQTGETGVPESHQQPLIDKLKTADEDGTLVTIGYADVRGDETQNKQLSYGRAQEVGNWIKGTLGENTNIEFFSMGETDRFSKTDYSKNRVVEVWQVAK